MQKDIRKKGVDKYWVKSEQELHDSEQRIKEKQLEWYK